MPAGRPKKWKSVEEMQEAIDAYFASCEANERPPTVTGLTLALDFADRSSLIDYQNDDEFSHTIKRAKLRVQETIESGMLKGYNAAGAIFNLKNNYGWKDKTEIDQTTKHEGMVEIAFRDASKED